MLKFNRLVSGGIITNYYCSSRCRHCVYNSSPHWPKDYMTAELADEIFSTLRKLGCYAVHIGGGEPLLNPKALLPILKSAENHGIHIEYIETNASWFKDIKSAGDLLTELKSRNVNTLLISIDPFHNEYVPFCKVKGLIEACHKFGIEVFPWLMDFWSPLDAMEDTRTHRLEDYERLFGTGYTLQLLRKYPLNLKGRALNTFKKYLKTFSVKEILQRSAPCMELTGVHHFHIDLYGNFIPQSCPGLSIALRDLAKGAAPEKYPVIHALYTTGIKGLYDLAAREYGFVAKESYAGKCDLCHDIRRYLVRDSKLNLPDLKPEGHYMFE